MRVLVVVGTAMAALVVAGCGGGDAAVESLAEQIAEQSDAPGDVDFDLQGEDGGFTIEGESDQGSFSMSIEDGELNMEFEDSGDSGTVTGESTDQGFTMDFEDTADGGSMEGADTAVGDSVDGGSFEIGGGELPDDLPVEVADGGEVVFSMQMDGATSVNLNYPGGDFDELAAFYEDQMAGIDPNHSTATFEPPRSVSYGASEGGANITVTENDADGSVAVNISIFQDPEG